MPSILVVDDDAVDRELVARCLKPLQGAQLDYARDGNEALEAISGEQPDVVLTDLRMPGMDGLELVRRLQEERPRLPVVLMTSQGNERLAVQALQAGASSYVPKRDLKSDLLETIEKALRIAEARRSRGAVLRHLGHCETHFELVNDLELIYPLAEYFQDNLDRLGFGTATDRSQVGIALMEAVSNAVIHGNLEVGSELRREGSDAYMKTIEQRRREPPYADRRVRFTARESAEAIRYTVADEGPGFDPASLPDPTAPENVLNVSGRGIMLIRTFMDEVRFSPKGNEITMTKTLAPARAAASDRP